MLLLVDSPMTLLGARMELVHKRAEAAPPEPNPLAPTNTYDERTGGTPECHYYRK